MVTTCVHSARTSCEIPRPSFPKTTATVSGAWILANGVPSMSVAQRGMPAVFHVRKSGSKGKRRTGIRAKEPMEACTTFG